jgi:hypothetical protein
VTHGGEGAGHTPRVPSWATVVVLVGVAVAAAVRLPAVGASLVADESGYTLVGRAWSPDAGSPFGHYWVDRPPMLIAVYRLADEAAGPTGIRWLAVVASALAVLASAALAREVVARLRPDASERDTGIVVAASALTATALVANASIGVMLAKGEILSLPLLVGSMWLTLLALRRGSPVAALAAGLLAGGALGLKQNLVGAIVFAAVLLLAERVRGRVGTRELLRLGAAFAAGAAVYVVATVAWALGAGVDLSALYYAVYGVRSDAVSVIADGPLGSVLRHAARMAQVTVTSGLVLVLVGLLVHVLRRGREATSVALATLAVALVDGFALLLGGAFRLPYLLAMVPSAVLAVAVMTADGRGRRTVRDSTVPVLPLLLVGVLVASSLVSGVSRLHDLNRFQRPTTAQMLGRSIGAAAEPGDSLTVVLGSADLQFQSGLPSPYTHLWSLPARVLDPGLRDLTALLGSPDAPTWVVVAYDLSGLADDAGARVHTALAEDYVEVGTACGSRVVYRRADQPRPKPVLRCAPMRRQFGHP